MVWCVCKVVATVAIVSRHREPLNQSGRGAAAVFSGYFIGGADIDTGAFRHGAACCLPRFTRSRDIPSDIPSPPSPSPSLPRHATDMALSITLAQLQTPATPNIRGDADHIRHEDGIWRQAREEIFVTPERRRAMFAIFAQRRPPGCRRAAVMTAPLIDQPERKKRTASCHKRQ